MNSKGQSSLEILIIFGILVLGSIIFGVFYFNSHQAMNTNKLDSATKEVASSLSYQKEVKPSSITCGNHLCEPGENCSNCSNDCGTCPVIISCGDNVCEGDENCQSCPGDCNSCRCMSLMSSTITFTPAEPVFYNTTNVSLFFFDANCDDANIYYTLDGTIPNSNSTLYQSPFNLTETKTINAKAFATSTLGNTVESNLFSKTYTLTTDPCYFGVGGGSGTLEDPIIICSAEELNKIREFSNNYFLLGADIDLDPGTLGDWYNQELGWEPIGNLSKPFTGYFYGNNHKISNLTINRDKEDYIGLFGYLGEHFEIKDLILENVNIIGGNNTGAVFGENINNTIITNVSITGTITGNSIVGGIAGKSNSNTTVSFCKTNVTVSGNNYVGGLVGYLENSNISESYSLGEITSFSKTKFTGGLLGFMSLGTLINSYSIASVIGESDVGGLVGNNDQGDISFCYSSGMVTGNLNIGGLVGSIIPEVKDTGNFWDADTSKQKDSAMGTGLITPEMQTQKTFEESGWDFSRVWGIEEGNSYPYLLNNPEK